MSLRNVQAMVPLETHRVLRDVAYEKEITLRNLIAEILNNFVSKVKGESQLQRELNAPK